MNNYKHILVAVDLSDDSAFIIDKARDIAKKYDSQLSLTHVMEPIAVGYAVEVSSIDMDSLHEECSKQAKTTLLEMGGNIGIPENRVHNLLGQPAREIRELAKKIGADLIVIGSHGRHGFGLILGSTANGVLHGAHCDVLTVRIPE